jgi:cytochrome b561
MQSSTASGQTGDQVYSPTARRFHWWTVAFILAQIPIGLYMVWRGEATGFDALTNQLYSSHKLIGFLILLLVVARLVYRFRNGAPPDEPTLEWWQKLASHFTHWGLYLLLLVIPILGWLGVSMYGARSIFGLFSLPAMASENQDRAALVFMLHKYAAFLLIAAVAMHAAAAIFHYAIRRDGVLQRMLPGLRRR